MGARPTLRHCALTPERLDDYLRFFDHRAFTDNPRWAGCYCYFPLHDPRKTDWEARTSSQNRTAVSDCVRAGRSHGYLAYDGDDVVGWCSAGKWSQFPMLGDVPEGDAETTGALMCFVVAPEWRGRGVASGLLGAACDGLRGQGATVVRARSVRSMDAARNHFGPLPMFLAAGFEITRERDDGTVLLRKRLD